jgi:AcrR family transcriptional regulator
VTDAEPRVRRTQLERRVAAEEALLRAAAELVAEQGIERTSLRAISARAGISRTMPGYHFGSKDALIARIAQRGQERTFEAALAAVEQAQQDMENLSKLDALVVTIDTYLDIFLRAEAPEEQAVVVMWGATFPSDSSMSAMVESDRQTQNYLALTIAEGQRDGSIRPDLDPESAAVIVTGLARGVAALSLTHPEIGDPHEVRQMCRDAIYAALADSR